MTVHNAKGLEFPIVILAISRRTLLRARRIVTLMQLEACARRGSCVRPLGVARARKPMSSTRERAEGVRVAYVASTRAPGSIDSCPSIGDAAAPGGGDPRPLNRSRCIHREANGAGLPEQGPGLSRNFAETRACSIARWIWHTRWNGRCGRACKERSCGGIHSR